MAVEVKAKDTSDVQTEQLMTGCEAIAEAIRLADVDVMAAYPIRPYDTVMQAAAKLIANGKMDCEYIVADGEQEAWIAERRTNIGGQLPVNTDGGCLACGEPIGASGLRQVYECALQLRGDAGPRQVPNEPQTAFTHVYGAPGISACTVLSR